MSKNPPIKPTTVQPVQPGRLKPVCKSHRYDLYETTWTNLNNILDNLIAAAPNPTYKDKIELDLVNELLDLDSYLKIVIHYFWNTAPINTGEINSQNVIPPGGGRKCQTRTSVA
jgi:hypothetical protein